MSLTGKRMLNEISKYEDPTLRNYQQHIKMKIYALWKDKKAIMLQMPTGTGKTKLFVSIINDIMNFMNKHNVRVDNITMLILAHRKELISQIIDEINIKYKLECSRIDAESKILPLHSKSICVASVPTLSHRLKIWETHSFDVIVVDEAHHVKSDIYKRILHTFKKAKILGVTATPYRMNGEGFKKEFDDIIISPSIKDFIDAGWLSNYKYCSIKRTNKFYKGLDKVPMDSYGDYRQVSLWDYCKADKIQANVVASYLKYAKGKKGIVYTINKQHNIQLCAEFRKCGINAYGIDSGTNSDERKHIINRFREGDISVLCNVNIFTEGFDCPEVEFIQLARPTKSLSLYLQQVGRGLRYSPRKSSVVIIDNVGLYNRFGLPSVERKWAHFFVGNKASYDDRCFAENREKEKSLIPRSFDFSEGKEKVILIENTGLNRVKADAEKEYLVTFESQLKPIIDSIFEINRIDCEKYIKGFDKEPHMIFDAKVIEDILSPCPVVTVKTDDMAFVQQRMENEYKPVASWNRLDYVKYKSWDDFKNVAIYKVKTLFKKQLIKDQAENYNSLKRFTANQLRVFFEHYYGKNHNMSKKLISYCEKNFDATWEEMQDDKEIKMHKRTVKSKGKNERDGSTEIYTQIVYYD